MKSIIETLYYNGLNDTNNQEIYQFLKEYRNEESAAFDLLQATLSPKDFDLVNDYEEKSVTRQAIENRKLYARGVKIGALLMLEILTTRFEE